MFRIISNSKYHLLTQANEKMESLEKELSFTLQKASIYLDCCEAKDEKIQELLKELEKYKTAFCDEVAKRLELTERVLELEKEQNDDSGNI